MSRWTRAPGLLLKAGGLAAVLGLIGLSASQVLGATNFVSGSENISGKVCVGSATCDNTVYTAATNNLEVIDTTPSIGLMNAKDNASPTISWAAIADSTGLSFRNQAAAFTPFFLDASGRVGVGTISPGAKLSVIGSQASTNIYLGNINPDTHTYRTQFLTDPTGFSLGTTIDGTTFNNAFTVGVGAPTASLAVTAAGRVGVGTAAPATPLQVGAGALVPITAGATVMLQQASVATSMVMKSSAGPEMFLYEDQNNGLVGTASNTPFGFRSNNTTRMWIGANGNIGIGPFLAAPTARLQFDTGANSDGVTWNNASSRSLKTNFAAADSQSVLEKLASLPMQTWNYKIDPTTLHLGPTAEDFQAAFGLGSSDKSISTLDMEGVTATAVQGLYVQLKDRDATIASLQDRLASVEGRLGSLDGRNATASTVMPAPAAASPVPASVAPVVHGNGGPGWLAFAAGLALVIFLVVAGQLRLARRPR